MRCTSPPPVFIDKPKESLCTSSRLTATCASFGKCASVASVFACSASMTTRMFMGGVTAQASINTSNAHQRKDTMKNGQNFRDLQTKKKEMTDEAWIHQPVCMVCKKEMQGYYARFGESGVCNSACMKVQDKVYRYPGHSEEDFLKRVGL